MPPESLATVLFGNVFGSLRWTYDYWGPGFDTLVEGSWTDRAINYLFAGTVPAVLILWHGIVGGRLFAREIRFFLLLGLAALFYALGRYTPVFEFIFDHVPGIDLYRRPADATFLINFALAFVSGYLVHRYLHEGAPRLAALRGALGGARLATAVALVGAAVASALVFAIPAGKAAEALIEVGLGTAIAAAAAWTIARSGATRHARTVVAALVVAFTGGELIVRNAASPLSAEPAERYAVFRELPPEQLQGLQALKRELDERHARGERPRVEILGLGGAWQNASMVLGLEDTIGYNPLRLADYERAVGAGENAVDPNLRHFPGTFRGYRCSLAGLLGLEYLVLDRPLERLPKHFPRLNGARLLYGSGAMWVYRLEPERAARLSRDAADPGRFRGGAGAGRAAGIRPRRRGPRRSSRCRPGSRAITACATRPPIPIRRGVRPRSCPTAATTCRSRSRPTATASSSCTTSITRAGRSTSTASAAPFCAQICCSEGSKCRPAVIASSSASARFRSTTSWRRRRISWRARTGRRRS